MYSILLIMYQIVRIMIKISITWWQHDHGVDVWELEGRRQPDQLPGFYLSWQTAWLVVSFYHHHHPNHQWPSSSKGQYPQSSRLLSDGNWQHNLKDDVCMIMMLVSYEDEEGGAPHPNAALSNADWGLVAGQRSLTPSFISYHSELTRCWWIFSYFFI